MDGTVSPMARLSGDHNDLLWWDGISGGVFLDDTGRTDVHVLSTAELGNNNTGRFIGADGMGRSDVTGNGAGTSGDEDGQDSYKDGVFRGVRSDEVTGDDSGDAPMPAKCTAARIRWNRAVVKSSW